MDWSAYVRTRLKLSGLDPAREAEIVEDVAHQMDDAYRDARASGLSEADARTRAERHITDWAALARDVSASPRLKQPAVDRWSAKLDDRAISRGRFGGILGDVRHGIRLMLKTPGFSALAILMLALGTGANAAVFSVVDAVMLRSPFEQRQEIALVLAVTADERRSSAVPKEAFDRLAGLSHVIASSAAYTIASPVVTNVDVPRRTQVECVPAAMADVLGTRPLMGRWFSAAEDVVGGPALGVASYTFWQGTLNSDPAVLGRRILLDKEPVTIVGVMPKGFDGVRSLPNRDLWVPYGQVTAERQLYGCRAPGAGPKAFVNALVRVQPNVSMEDANAAITSALGPQPAPSGGSIRLNLLSSTEALVGDLRGMFIALTGAVIAILLIACVNVANLGIARLVGRRREIAVRLSLGATRGRILRQTVTEQLVLASVGAGVGIAVAFLTIDAVIGLVPRGMPQATLIELNPRVLIAAIGVTMLASLAVGLIPGWQASSTSIRTGLAEGARAHTAGGRRVRSVLVVVELALGVMLLVGALLMIRTFLVLRPSAPGFDPTDKVLALARLPQSTTNDDRRHFVNEVTAKLREVPGVRAVAGTTYFPMSRSVSLLKTTVEGRTVEINVVTTSANYLDVMRIPLKRGRSFLETDNSGSDPVALVNETFVRRFFNGREPLGSVIRIENVVAPVERRIVGVIGDTRWSGADTLSRAEIQLPFGQEIEGPPYFIVSASASTLAALPTTIRQVVSAVRPGQLVDRIDRLDTLLASEVAYPRLAAWLLGLFGGLAVLLAAVGLGSTLAWSVAERRKEIGLRMALGAAPRAIGGLIVGHTFRLTALATALGLAGAFFGTRLLEAWMYGVSRTDMSTYVICGVAMLAIALVAAYLPTRRATRVDPLTALRTDN
jgi:putative ABC transport system permease protein